MSDSRPTQRWYQTTLTFKNTDAKRAFWAAWNDRMVAIGASEQDIFPTGLVVHFFGEDDCDRAADVANEVVGVTCETTVEEVTQ